ncbi:hypothetical protein CFC35_11770 [Streptomyces sp. FBKL.4005]|nr:hypothetical protein CFC35_11770 [Streptomyces sp. FBKL.4005]
MARRRPTPGLTGPAPQDHAPPGLTGPAPQSQAPQPDGPAPQSHAPGLTAPPGTVPQDPPA